MSSDFPTPYSDLNIVLKILVSNIKDILGESFIGAYLQGSFAVGGFDKHSDVDFIIVIQHELSTEQVDSLQEMHANIFQNSSYWAQHLEGSYFPIEILKDIRNQGQELWYLDNGANHLIKADHCNTVVVRWVLREKGITLAGPNPSLLLDQIPAEILRKDIFSVIQNWGNQILSNSEPYRNHFYQTFIVLSFCRMLHDLQSGTCGSKPEGAEWAKKTLDPRWHDLIDRTWLGRPVPEISVRRPADPIDFEKTLEFVKYAMDQSRKY